MTVTVRFDAPPADPARGVRRTLPEAPAAGSSQVIAGRSYEVVYVVWWAPEDGADHDCRVIVRRNPGSGEWTRKHE